jgi:hypothetical protein
MNRRSVIKNLVVFTGGIFILPACSTETKPTSILLKNIKINSDQERLIEELAETILPESDTPGAKSLGLHSFILKMVDECHDEKDRVNFVSGLSDLETYVENNYDQAFYKCSKSQKEEILNYLEQLKADNSVKEFYSIAKHQIINGYKNSEYFMTNIRVYELVPGRYNGFYKVNPANAKAYV